MIRKFVFCIAFIVLSCACEHRINSNDLNMIDSLVNAEKYDSAYNELVKIKATQIANEGDKAHYNLLLTRTAMLDKEEYLTDSLIDYSISYYEKADDKERLCDSYYYKAQNHINRGEYEQAILLVKKAESFANQTNNKAQRLKIAECIAYINGVSGNHELKLQYTKQSMNYAHETGNIKWIMFSYCRMCETYLALGQTDSAVVYADKIIVHLEDADKDNLPYFLNTIGYAYMDINPSKSKILFEKSLSYKPLTRTFENLAWVCHLEGNEQKAYECWKQSLLLEDENSPKDRILYNILQYDIEHHNFEEISQRIAEIVTIKDSLNEVLRDRSILKIQQEFDEKATQEKQEQKMLRWIIVALILVVIILLLIGYIQYRRHKAKLQLAEHLMLINGYQGEINRLKNTQEGTEQQIADLNNKINDLIEQDSPSLYHGKLLYDDIEKNGTTVTWTKNDFQNFIDYYKATNFPSYSRLMKKYSPRTVHNIFFLILYEMGKEDKDVRCIMNITQEAIRSTRHRIKINKHK